MPVSQQFFLSYEGWIVDNFYEIENFSLYFVIVFSIIFIKALIFVSFDFLNSHMHMLVD